jgi:nitric oxide reductase activation protein
VCSSDLFNIRSYVVEPPYRDDNLGLWDFNEEQMPQAMEAELLFDSVRIEEQDDDDDTPPDREREEHEQSDEEDANRVNLAITEEEGIPVARYPEYDYSIGRDRSDWTTIVEYTPPPGAAHVIDDMLERHSHTVNRIKSLIDSARVGRPQRIKRLQEGDFLDIDASIEAMISRRIGENPDPRVYGRFERKHRDLAVNVLLDISESTKDKITASDETVLDVERQATALLAHAMAGLGDPFAIAAFCSNRRDDVRYYRIKDFGSPYGAMSKSFLAGLQGGFSTRIGAAMRHAAEDLKRQQTHRRLLLVVTDGEPSDIDVTDKKYLVEDARHVIHELAMDGIDVFCVGLDSGGDSYLTRIFGRRNVVQIDKLERLPEKLPMIYLRLTT